MAGPVAGASTQRRNAYSRNESARSCVCGGSGGILGLQDRAAVPRFVKLALEALVELRHRHVGDFLGFGEVALALVDPVRTLRTSM